MADGTSVDLSEAAGYLDKVEAGMRAAAIRGLRSAALRCVQIIVTEIIPSRSPQPVDRGVFRAGWRSETLEDGATIENNEPHAVFIEEGVRGANVKIGKKMLEALAEWALRKKLAGDAAAAKKVAWAVAKAAKRRGIFGGGQGLGILAELLERRVEKIVQEEVAREIERG